MRTRPSFVQSPQSERANMACLVIARCYGGVFDGAGADETDIAFNAVVDGLFSRVQRRFLDFFATT